MRRLSSFSIVLLLIAIPFASSSPAEDHFRWNLPDGAVARLGKGRLFAVAYSPAGKVLAVASNIGIWLYDARTGDEVNLLTGHGNRVRSISFSPDGKTLASGSGDGNIRIGDIDNDRVIAMQSGHRGGVYEVLFSPDGQSLASGGQDGDVGLWDVSSGREKARFDHGRGYVSSVSFSPDGTTLASGGNSDLVKLWDLDSGQQQGAIRVNLQASSVSFSPDGMTLAISGGPFSAVALWDAAGRREESDSGRPCGWYLFFDVFAR